MASMACLYGKAIRDELELFASWPIGTQLSLGDVGFLTKKGKLFERWNNLKDFGINFVSQKATIVTDFDFTLGKHVKILFKAAGEAPLDGSFLTTAQVGVSLVFDRKSSIVLRAHTKEEFIRDLQKLEAEVIRKTRDKTNKWKSDFVIVTATYESVGTTIILSSGRSSRVEITANAGIDIPFDLADAQIGLEASVSCQKLIKALARKKFIPFVCVHHLKGTNWNNPTLSRYGS